MLAAMAAHIPSEAAASVNTCGGGGGGGGAGSSLGRAAGRVSWTDRKTAAAAVVTGSNSGVRGECAQGRRIRAARLDESGLGGGGARPVSVAAARVLASGVGESIEAGTMRWDCAAVMVGAGETAAGAAVSSWTATAAVSDGGPSPGGFLLASAGEMR